MILIVGGYGAVGREVAARVAPAFPGSVRVAGRNRESADACASRIGHGAEGLHLDVNAPSHRAPALKRGDVVVMCTDQEEPLLAQQALAAGANYVDITADLGRLRALEQLDALARRNRATGVLSVGLAPGLTNLLAARATQRLQRVHRLDLIVLLAAGDAHGRAAVEWTLDNLDARFDATRAGRPRPVRAFANRLHVETGPGWEAGPAFRFPFSEQRTLALTLGVPDVNSWLALEPPVTGYLTALLARTAAVHLLRVPRVRRLAVGTLRLGAPGSKRSGALVLAHGIGANAGVLQLSARGNGQSEVTALVAATVVRHLVDGPPPPGVHHIDQLPRGEALVAQLKADGLTVSEHEPAVGGRRQEDAQAKPAHRDRNRARRASHALRRALHAPRRPPQGPRVDG